MSNNGLTQKEIKAQLAVLLMQWTPKKWWQRILRMYILKELND